MRLETGRFPVLLDFGTTTTCVQRKVVICAGKFLDKLLCTDRPYVAEFCLVHRRVLFPATFPPTRCVRLVCRRKPAKWYYGRWRWNGLSVGLCCWWFMVEVGHQAIDEHL